MWAGYLARTRTRTRRRGLRAAGREEKKPDQAGRERGDVQDGHPPHPLLRILG
jgi:hypothetical protein